MDLNKVQQYAIQIASMIEDSEIEIKGSEFKEFLYGNLLAIMMICQNNLDEPIIENELDVIILFQRLHIEFMRSMPR